MALSPGIASTAALKLRDLKQRKADWDRELAKLAGPQPPLPPAPRAATPVGLYEQALRDARRDAALFKKQTKPMAALENLGAGRLSGLSETLAKKKLPPETSLVNLYSRRNAAQRTVTAIEGRLHLTAMSPLAADARFFNRLDSYLKKGKYAEANALIKGKEPGLFKRWSMGAAGRAAWQSDKRRLQSKVGAYQDAKEKIEKTEKSLGVVEKETAKAIQKILKSDGGRLLNAANPAVAALAARDHSLAFLLGLGAKPSVATITSKLQIDGAVSLNSVKTALTALHQDTAAKYRRAKEEIPKAEQRLGDCENFIKSCRISSRYELSAANGHGTRNDLIQNLEDILVNPAANDRDARRILSQVNSREKRWADAGRMRDIALDANALSRVGTFQHSMLHPGAMPAFSRAARTTEQAAQAVMGGMHHAVIPAARGGAHLAVGATMLGVGLTAGAASGVAAAGRATARTASHNYHTRIVPAVSATKHFAGATAAMTATKAAATYRTTIAPAFHTAAASLATTASHAYTNEISPAFKAAGKTVSALATIGYHGAVVPLMDDAKEVANRAISYVRKCLHI